MNEQEEITKEQERKLTEARLRMILRMPYYGNFILGIDMVPDKKLPHQAGTDGRVIRYNPEKLLSKETDEIVAVLAHEVLHLSFKHPLRRNHRDPKLWNIACLTGDTLITLEDDRDIPISQIQGGMLVRTPLGANKVLLVTKTKKSSIVELVMSNGRKVTSTNEHKFLTKEGFLKAGQIKEGTEIIVDSRRSRVSGKELPIHDVNGIGERAGLHLSSGGSGAQVLWSLGSQKASDLDQFYSPERSNRLGLSGGDSGRRGNDYRGSTPGEGKDVLHSHRAGGEHQSASSGLVGETGDARSFVSEQSRPLVLEGTGVWLGDKSIVAWDASLSRDQETSRRVIAEIHSSAARVSEILSTLAGNGEIVQWDQDIECARVSEVRQWKEETEVYDLVTELHCYIANGAVVHNCDMVVNPILVNDQIGKMPAQYIIHPPFANMTAEAVYDQLVKMMPPPPPPQGGAGQKPPPGKGKMPPGMGNANMDSDDPGDMGSVTDPQAKDGSGKASEGEMAVIEAGLDGKIAAAAQAAKAQGKLPAGFERLLVEALKPKIDWKDRLKKFVAKTIPADFTWMRPSRRSMANGIYMPSSVKNGCGKIVVVIDTSGSIGNEELAQFWGETMAIFEDCNPEELHVIYCDAAVAGHDVFRFGETPKLKPRGGGGTDFRPPFKKIERDNINPQCLIYISDLYGSFGDKAPAYPVLWVCTTDVVAPWGETLPLKL